MTKEVTLWQSYGMYDLKELEELKKDSKQFLEEEYGEDYPDGVDDERVTDEVYDRIDMSYEDELMNLNRTLDGEVIAIADIGLWYGRRSGYQILKNNLNEVISFSLSCDERKVYCDRYNVKAYGYHHDGSNEVVFREVRPNRDINRLLDKIYNGETISQRTINYYTKSLRPYIKEVYGV